MSESEILGASAIPSVYNADELAQKDMLLALDRVAHSQDADSAKVYIERAIATGLPHFRFSEIIRGIEARLPPATPQQCEAVSLLKEKATGIISIGRVLGAFDDIALVLLENPEPGSPFKVLAIGGVDREEEIESPAWDVTRPGQRRVWFPAESPETTLHTSVGQQAHNVMQKAAQKGVSDNV